MIDTKRSWKLFEGDTQRHYNGVERTLRSEQFHIFRCFHLLLGSNTLSTSSKGPRYFSYDRQRSTEELYIG